MQHYKPSNEPIAAEWRPRAAVKARFGFGNSTLNRLIAAQLVDARKLGGGLVLVNIPSVERYVAGLPRPSIRQDDRSAKLARRAA
jgi:hypothetical protein